MAQSYEDGSRPPTNARGAHFLFRGRRMWPQARKSADPGRGVWGGIGETVEDLGVVQVERES